MSVSTHSSGRVPSTRKGKTTDVTAAIAAVETVAVFDPASLTTVDEVCTYVHDSFAALEIEIKRTVDLTIRVKVNAGLALIHGARIVYRDGSKKLPDKWTWTNVAAALGIERSNIGLRIGVAWDSMGEVIDLARGYEHVPTTGIEEYTSVLRRGVEALPVKSNGDVQPFNAKTARQAANVLVDPSAGSNRKLGAQRKHNAIAESLSTGRIVKAEDMGDATRAKFDKFNELMPSVTSWSDLVEMTNDDLATLLFVIAQVKANKPKTSADVDTVTS